MPRVVRVILKMGWAGHASRVGETINAYKILVGKPGGKRPLGRIWHSWEDNVKMESCGNDM